METNGMTEHITRRSLDIRNEINDLVKEFCDLKYAHKKFDPEVDSVPVDYAFALMLSGRSITSGVGLRKIRIFAFLNFVRREFLEFD